MNVKISSFNIINYETFFTLKHIQKSLQTGDIRYENKIIQKKNKINAKISTKLCDWRRFDKQKISYTKSIQIWSYSLLDKKAEIWPFCP